MLSISSTILPIEVFFTAVAILVSFALPNTASAFFRAVEHHGGRLARRRSLAILLVGLSAPVLRLCLLPLQPIPQPAIHDEFSHLLAAQTFASGRLTTATHPMWRHFETFHVDQRPTYMSMYPPAQGLALALGRVAFGHPWFGVCVSVGLMCAAITWMLYGWLPPGWALLGGALAVARIGIFSYWIDSYWGGALAALGGALTLGAMPRLIRVGARPRLATALLLGFGLVILANSRPYEGFVLALPVALALGMWLFGDRRPSMPVLVRRVLAPLCLVLTTGACLMGYYNWRVFGSPSTLPYQVNRATYAVSPVFIWQQPRPEPTYRHAVMRRFYVDWELPIFVKARTWGGFLEALGTKLGDLALFFYGPLLLVALTMLGRTLRDRRIRWMIPIAGVYLLGLAGNAFSVPHYHAPATALLYVIVVQCMRHLRLCRPGGQPVGRSLVRLLPALCAAMLVVQGAMALATPRRDPPRTRVEHSLESLPGRHVAIVRYAAGHDPMDEWVYNEADIDGAKLVWARDMTREENADLLRYFARRTAWLIEPDGPEPRVSLYVP